MNASTLTVNGASKPLGSARTLAQLLETLGVTVKKMAVERNGEIIRPAAYGDTPVAPGDRIEIIQFVGGG